MGHVTRPAKGGKLVDLGPEGGNLREDLSSGGRKGSDHRRGSPCGCARAGPALTGHGADGRGGLSPTPQLPSSRPLVLLNIFTFDLMTTAINQCIRGSLIA